MANPIWDPPKCPSSDPLICGDMAPSYKLLRMYRDILEKVHVLELKYCECAGGAEPDIIYGGTFPLPEDAPSPGPV